MKFKRNKLFRNLNQAFRDEQQEMISLRDKRMTNVTKAYSKKFIPKTSKQTTKQEFYLPYNQTDN